MNKLFSILTLAVLFSISATAQVDKLSSMDEKPEQKPSTKQPKDINISTPINILLKADGTWAANNEKYVVVTANDGNKYVLFANGKWSIVATLKDIDGNSYEALKIGKYYWTIQNLRTTKYNDGKAINYAPTDNQAWKSNSGAYTNVEDKAENKDKDGLLYSWHAANNPNLCPKGWRVPTEAEWMDLFNSMGGLGNAGKELKSVNGWIAPDGVSTNVAGEDNYMFNALPTGYRQMHGEKRNFWQVGGEATFWTKTPKTESQAISITINVNNQILNRSWPKEFGRSIRCIKD